MIWTWLIKSIFYIDNHYNTCTSSEYLHNLAGIRFSLSSTSAQIKMYFPYKTSIYNIIIKKMQIRKLLNKKVHNTIMAEQLLNLKNTIIINSRSLLFWSFVWCTQSSAGSVRNIKCNVVKKVHTYKGDNMHPRIYRKIKLISKYRYVDKFLLCNLPPNSIFILYFESPNYICILFLISMSHILLCYYVISDIILAPFSHFNLMTWNFK